MFNPVIFATITGKTRAQLYRFVSVNGIEKDIVAFATDSICVKKELTFGSTKLGRFSLSDSAVDFYYLQNGFYRFNGKWKQRGFGKLASGEIEHLDIVERKGRLHYQFQLTRNARLRSSIIRNRVSEIGKIRSVTREIDLNAAGSRLKTTPGNSFSTSQVNYNVLVGKQRYFCPLQHIFVMSFSPSPNNHYLHSNGV